MEEVNNWDLSNNQDDKEGISELTLIIWIIVKETEVGPQLGNWWFKHHSVCHTD